MLNQLKNYAVLMRLHKPIGIYVLLWPTLWALWIAAKGIPDISILVIFILGTIVMRSAGCVINDFADRNVDGKVKRTRERMLPTKKVSSKEALMLFAILIAIAFFLVLFLNKFAISLAFFAVFIASFYPFTKRFTYWPQAYLGFAFAWGIPMAFAAQSNHLPPVAWILFLATYFWIIAYDTMYAMVDRDDDVKIGVKSTAILFGNADRLVVGLLQAGFLGLLLLVGFLQHLNLWFYIGWLCAVGFSVYQQYLIKDRERDKCFHAFLNNHWLGLFFFVFLVASYWK